LFSVVLLFQVQWLSQAEQLSVLLLGQLVPLVFLFHVILLRIVCLGTLLVDCGMDLLDRVIVVSEFAFGLKAGRSVR